MRQNQRDAASKRKTNASAPARDEAQDVERFFYELGELAHKAPRIYNMLAGDHAWKDMMLAAARLLKAAMVLDGAGLDTASRRMSKLLRNQLATEQERLGVDCPVRAVVRRPGQHRVDFRYGDVVPESREQAANDMLSEMRDALLVYSDDEDDVTHVLRANGVERDHAGNVYAPVGWASIDAPLLERLAQRWALRLNHATRAYRPSATPVVPSASLKRIDGQALVALVRRWQRDQVNLAALRHADLMALAKAFLRCLGAASGVVDNVFRVDEARASRRDQRREVGRQQRRQSRRKASVNT